MSDSTLSSKDFWTTEDVARYLSALRGRVVTVSAAKVWMWRKKVRRSSGNQAYTRKEWVVSVLNKKR